MKKRHNRKNACKVNAETVSSQQDYGPLTTLPQSEIRKLVKKIQFYLKAKATAYLGAECNAINKRQIYRSGGNEATAAEIDGNQFGTPQCVRVASSMCRVTESAIHEKSANIGIPATT